MLLTDLPALLLVEQKEPTWLLFQRRKATREGLQLNLDSEQVFLAAFQRGRPQSSASLRLRASQTQP
ncbi:hypothetical protein BsWGS_15146 [Bradybaena similaris]